MKTGLDQLTILYTLLSASPLKAAITGGIYKLDRPNNAQAEDVVINTLPVSGDQVQRGTANVNIYVADVPQVINGTAQKVPDTARMQVLTGIALTALKEHYSQAYSFWVVNIGLMAEPDSGQHYVNVRIDFQFYPTV